ncbi:MAG: hypothetical protein KatS3mg004_3434 [Bryobacteraceae bacterium]|nr:MAG: hypothetical protein KatS3mg004_3434 [Bryobacteraceae bacterium]
MALFKSDILTATRVEICGDRWRPDMGTLRPRSGSTQHTLVHGDDYEEIEGNQYSCVQKNRTLKTTGNYSCSVQGDRCMDETNRTHQTRGNFTSNVTGTTTLNRVGATTENYTQPLTENHSAPRHTNEPTQWFETKGFQGSLIGMSVDVVNYAYSLTNLDLCLFNLAVNQGLMELAAKYGSIEIVLAKAEIEGVKTEARAVEAKAGAVDVDSALDVSSAHLSSNSRVM